MVEQANLCKLISKLEKGQQVTIVALGDSNTELTFHTKGHLNWPYLLQVALFEKYGPNKVIMINAGHCGQGAKNALPRLKRDVLRFDPDMVIICFWDGNMDDMRELIKKIRQSSDAEILLRTPNPIVATNQPSVVPKVAAGKEWPNTSVKEVVQKIVKLGKELNITVVDHYKLWIESDYSHNGPDVTTPSKLWLRMSDSFHPGPLGHKIFYRELTPYFGLPEKLSWE